MRVEIADCDVWVETEKSFFDNDPMGLPPLLPAGSTFGCSGSLAGSAVFISVVFVVSRRSLTASYLLCDRDHGHLD